MADGDEASRAPRTRNTNTRNTNEPTGDKVRPSRQAPGAKALTAGERRKVQQEVEGGLLFVNMALRKFAPMFVLDDSGMDPQTFKPEGNEVQQLAEAMTDEIAANAKLRAFFKRAGEVSPHIKLLLTVGGIVFARVLYWQALAEQQRQREGAEDGTTGEPPSVPGDAVAPPLRMAPGATYGGGGDDGQRQVDAHGSPGAVA